MCGSGGRSGLLTHIPLWCSGRGGAGILLVLVSSIGVKDMVKERAVEIFLVLDDKY